jgi:hypothetical protein
MLLTSWGFNAEPPASGDVPIPGGAGWKVVYERSLGGARGSAHLVSDSSASFSPSNVYDFLYPEGMVEGTAPATVYYTFRAREVYAAFWWKASAPFDLGPNGNKIAFLPTCGIQSISTCFSSARRGVATAAPGSGRPITTGSTTSI